MSKAVVVSAKLFEDLLAENARLEAENARLRAALEEYAEHSRWAMLLGAGPDPAPIIWKAHTAGYRLAEAALRGEA